MTRNKTSTYKYLMAFGYLCMDIALVNKNWTQKPKN